MKQNDWSIMDKILCIYTELHNGQLTATIPPSRKAGGDTDETFWIKNIADEDNSPSYTNWIQINPIYQNPEKITDIVYSKNNFSAGFL